MVKLSLIPQQGLPREDQDHLRWIGEAVKLGLSPWDPGKITFYSSNYDGPFNPIITVDTELLPRLPFSAQLDLLSMDEHQAMCKVADEAFEWFRYRHAKPIDNPNIILGEE